MFLFIKDNNIIFFEKKTLSIIVLKILVRRLNDCIKYTMYIYTLHKPHIYVYIMSYIIIYIYYIHKYKYFFVVLLFFLVSSPHLHLSAWFWFNLKIYWKLSRTILQVHFTECQKNYQPKSRIDLPRKLASKKSRNGF